MGMVAFVAGAIVVAVSTELGCAGRDASGSASRRRIARIDWSAEGVLYGRFIHVGPEATNPSRE